MVYQDDDGLWRCGCSSRKGEEYCVYESDWRLKDRSIIEQIELIHKAAHNIYEEARREQEKLEIKAAALYYHAKVEELHDNEEKN